jgi:hypothetical protein
MIRLKLSYLIGDQFQTNVRKWLGTQDPSVNHISNAAYRAHRRETAVWFTEGDTFAQWRASGSLLLIYGKRTTFLPKAYQLLLIVCSTSQRGRARASFGASFLDYI